MLRRILLAGASLAAALAVPTTAEASWWVQPPKKPKHVHIIAVRRGHRIIWKVRNHGLANKKKKLHPVNLSSDFSLRLGSRAVVGPSQPITFDLGTCPTTPATDGMASYAPYGQGTATGPFSDVLTCFGGGGPSTEFYAAITPPIGCQFPRADGTLINADAEFVNYLDGEWAVVCGVPNDPSTSLASTVFSVNPVYDTNRGFKFVQQGFTCQDTVGTNSDGNTPDNIRNKDSIEFYQSLGNNTYSITTSCIGNLHNAPGNPTPPSTPTAHWLTCLEYNPFPGASLQGLGVSVSYPDGQYSETCNVPNYKAS